MNSIRWETRGFVALLHLLISVAVVGQDGDGGLETVRTKDGRVETGKVTGDKTVLVDAGPRHVYLTSAIVLKRDPDARGAKEVPVFEFHQEAKNKKKLGTIALVPDQVVWGQWTPDGRLPVTVTDKKNGQVNFTLHITRIDPEIYRMEGDDYVMEVNYDVKGNYPYIRSIITASLKDEPERLLKGARFFGLVGDIALARSLLDRLGQIDPDNEALGAEREGLARQDLASKVRDVERFFLSGRLARAVAAFEGMGEEKASASGMEPSILEGIRSLVAAMKGLKEQFPDLGFDPTPGEARRLVKILSRAKARDVRIPAEKLSPLAGRWAEPLGSLDLTAAEIDEAILVARETEEFFLAGSRNKARDLARNYEKSSLPLELLLSIFRHADRFEESGPVDWAPQEFTSPVLRGKKFYYHAILPSDYSTRRAWPVILSLHGMHSKPVDMKRRWARMADEWGFILLLPEYIYGREWGYKANQEEREAVVGALWHASARFRIDPDQVFLQGQSQGGHAVWDMGMGRAGHWAGVIPVIGCAFTLDHMENFKDTALYCIDGSEDGAAPEVNRKSMTVLGEHGADATYVEYPGRGHEAFLEEYDRVVRWMHAHRRPAFRREIHLVPVIASDIRREWIEITRVDRRLEARGPVSGRPVVRVTGRWEPNRCCLEARGAREVVVYLPAEAIDFDEPVKIVVNDKTLHDRRLKPNWSLALDEAREGRDRTGCYLGRIKVRIR